MSAPKAESPTAPAPRANPDLVGHGPAEQTLLRAHGSGRLPHAWLLSGPRGIGKATLAYRFARYVLAGGSSGGGLFAAQDLDESLALDPDHTVARRVAADGHRDLRTLERRPDPRTGRLRGKITVGEARGAGQFLHLTAAEGGWRVVIVDPIDELNRNAANALLKMLEEPPDKALLLLVSHAPGRLLPTIRSRCCNLALGPLAPETVDRLMARYAPDLPVEERVALARLGEGSIGRALDLAANGGLGLYRELMGLLESLPSLDAAAANALGDRLGRGAEGAAFRTVSELLIWWLARLIRTRAGAAPLPEVVPGEGALMGRLMERHGLAYWLDLWEKTSRLLTSAEPANLDRKQVFITALLGLETAAS